MPLFQGTGWDFSAKVVGHSPVPRASVSYWRTSLVGFPCAPLEVHSPQHLKSRKGDADSVFPRDADSVLHQLDETKEWHVYQQNLYSAYIHLYTNYIRYSSIYYIDSVPIYHIHILVLGLITFIPILLLHNGVSQQTQLVQLFPSENSVHCHVRMWGRSTSHWFHGRWPVSNVSCGHYWWWTINTGLSFTCLWGNAVAIVLKPVGKRWPQAM